MSIIHVVSMSGGKDSLATALLARELVSHEDIRYVFADTGNEDRIVYEYLDYLEATLKIQIVRLKRDFTDMWWHRRDFIRDKWPEKMAKERAKPDGDEGDEDDVQVEGPLRWTADEIQAIVARALGVFEAGPSGNPYLDLCAIKGRFPGRKSQFCTQFLKTEPLVEYQMGLMDGGHVVWSWQGIRNEESPGRAKAPEFEEVGGGLCIYRPIKRWTAADVFEAHAVCGVKPNPLYLQGMTRVGCMPCINASKGEVAEIARRFPEHIERIERWERVVGQAGKRDGHSSFFPAPDGARGERQGKNIRQFVQWAKTSRGGRQYDIFKAADWAPACSSAYGLCE